MRKAVGQLSLTRNLGKVMRQIDLETIPNHTKNKKVLGSTQYGFIKGNPNLMHWLSCESQRIMISTLMSSWRPVPSVALRG